MGVQHYNKRIHTLLGEEKKLLKNRERLTDTHDPFLFLQRSDGTIQLHKNVKGTEFKVPGLPEGVEKNIILGRQFQVDIPYAGRKIRVYWCHEDYAFPHIWTKPQVYQGEFPERIRQWLTDPKQITDHPNGIPIILELAQVGSEVMRDRERKALIAWEKFKTGAKAQNIKAWAKFLIYIAGAIALVLIAWSMFGPEPAKDTAIAVANTVNQSTGTVIF